MRRFFFERFHLHPVQCTADEVYIRPSESNFIITQNKYGFDTRNLIFDVIVFWGGKKKKRIIDSEEVGNLMDWYGNWIYFDKRPENTILAHNACVCFRMFCTDQCQ